MSILLLFLIKDLRDARKNRYVWPVYILLPLFAIGLSVLFTLISPELAKAALEEKDEAFLAIIRAAETSEDFAGLPLDEAMARFILRNVLGFYLFMPVVLSSISAAFSIVGEKQQRTLEPILATPITDFQFLLGKLLASLFPAILLTWITAAATVLIVDFISLRQYGSIFLPDQFWVIVLLVLSPLMGAASVLATMRFSAKMSDPQAASQFTGLVIVPVFILGLGLFGKAMTLSISAVYIACLFALLLDVALLRLNVKKFNREEILTKWK